MIGWWAWGDRVDKNVVGMCGGDGVMVMGLW